MENSNRLIQRTLITFSVTYIVVNLASNSAYLIDEIVVARLLGSAEMAAVGLASPCFAIPLCEIVILAYYLIYSFITCRNEKTALDKVLLFSESFDDTIAGVMTLSVTSMEDVVTVSRNVDLFLRESGCESKKKIYVAALALEEMAGNIVSHGFVLDDANHNCDISIVLEKNQRICLHIRDDCPLFDVRKQFEAMRSDSIEKNIGIKMIFTLAQDVKYVNLLNLNTLIIKI